MALVLHAKFNEGTGSNTVNEINPSHVGVLEGSTSPTWLLGDIDRYCLSFNGEDGGAIVRFPESVATKITGALTVAFWAKTAELLPGSIMDGDQKAFVTRGGGNFDFGFEGESASGAEKLTDGDCEVWTDVNTLTNWNKYVQGGTSNLVRSEDEHGGTYAASMVIDGSGNDVEISQSFSVEAGKTYELQIYHKETGSTELRFWLRDDEADPDTFLHMDGSWSSDFVYLSCPHADTYTKCSVKFTAENTGTMTLGISGNDASETYYVDDVHVGQYYTWLRCFLRRSDSTYEETEWRDDNPQPGYRDDEWHHFLIRFSPASGPSAGDGEFQLWVDGVLKDDETGHNLDDLKVSGVEDWWIIGGRKSTSTSVIDRNIESLIDEVRIYDEYVSDSVIAELANPSAASNLNKVYLYYLKD